MAGKRLDWCFFILGGGCLALVGYGTGEVAGRSGTGGLKLKARSAFCGNAVNGYIFDG